MVCACVMCTWHGPFVHAVAGREAVTLRFLAEERHLLVQRSRTSRTPRRRPLPTEVMQVPPSGLPSAPTGSAGASPFGRRRLRSRMIGLKLTLTSWSAKSCVAEEIEQRRDSCRPSSRRSCRRWRCGRGRRRARMFSMMRSKVPWPPRSGRIRLCVSLVAVERDLDAVQAERQQPIDDLRRQQQAVGDDVDAQRRRRARRAARHARSARQYITGRLSSGSPPKNISDELLGTDAIELALDPRRDALRGLERHLVGELVVVAVVALVAVVAGEVALQRRQHRDVQLGRCRS